MIQVLRKRGCRCKLTTGDMSKDLEMGLLGILDMAVDEPADQNVENNDKDHAKR